MFKKVLALTLAVVMLLMPMTASAVTWNTIVSQLNTVGSYTEEGGTLTAKTEDGVTTVQDGNIDFNEDILAAGTYVFVNITSDGMLYAIASKDETINVRLTGETNINQVWGHAQGSGATVSITNEAEVGELFVVTREGGVATAINEGEAGSMTGRAYDKPSTTTVINKKDGVVTDGMQVLADGNGYAKLENAGSAGSVFVHAQNDGLATGTNDGTVTGDMTGSAYDGSLISVKNNGDVGGELWASAHDASVVKMGNDGSADNLGMYLSKNSDGSLTLTENSSVNGTDAWNYIYSTSDSGAVITNYSDLNNLMLTAFNGGYAEFDNTNGTIGEVVLRVDEGSAIEFNGTDRVESSEVYVTTSNELSTEQLKGIAETYGALGGIILFQMDENGECLGVYEVTEEGELILLDWEIEEDEEDEEPEPEPDPIELQRQAEGIGGVTTSPVWNWQGYLGHSSKPMWIYVNGEKVLMRQRLFWLGDSTKNHTCRINVAEPDPASIELRVGLDMLRTAQRAEISVISILDKDSNPIAQFAVSDLLGAFEQYGLEEGELLCVSADPDAEVMKVTLDGEYLPLEEAEEENAAA